MNAPNQLSFLPDDYLERKAQRRTNVICAVLAAIVMAAIGSAFSLTERMNQAAQQKHAAIEQEYADAAKQIQLVQDMQAKQSRMARQAELAASLLEKIPRSIILAEITNALPRGVSLLELNMDCKKKNSTAPTVTVNNLTGQTFTNAPAPSPTGTQMPEPIVYDVQVRVTGIAANDIEVAEFIRRLSISPLFSDVNLIISDEFTQDQTDKDAVKLRRFTIETVVNNNADVTNLGGKLPDNSTVQLPSN